MEKQSALNKVMGIFFVVLLLVFVGELVYLFLFVKNPASQADKTGNVNTNIAKYADTVPSPTPKAKNTSWDNWETKYSHLSYSEMVTTGKFLRFETNNSGKEEQVNLYVTEGDDVFYIFYYKNDTSKISFVDSKDQPIKESDLKPGDMLELREIFDKNAKDGVDYKLTVKKQQ